MASAGIPRRLGLIATLFALACGEGPAGRDSQAAHPAASDRALRDDPCLCFHSGDVTADGILSAGDGQQAFFIALGVHQPSAAEQCAADVNGDGLISAGDAQGIFRAALGMGSVPFNLPNGQCCTAPGQCAGGQCASGVCGAGVPQPTGLVAPGELSYLGAFRLPGGGERPYTFEYGGNAMAWRPDGDPGGAGDGFAGSLFVMGHDRLPWGELPNGSQVAEVSIPAPVVSSDIAGLPSASFLQGFAEVTGPLFLGQDELPRAGLLYYAHPVTGPRLHLAWGQHLEPEGLPTHALLRPTLSTPAPQGAWFIGQESPYTLNDYLLEIPAAWATAVMNGRVLATGRYRDGGWGSKGPALHAYVPWVDAGGTLAPAGTRLAVTTLLRYGDANVDESPLVDAMPGYQHPDEWAGGAWLVTAEGHEAVVFAGTKSHGTRYWYGYRHPASPDLSCVDGDMVGQFTVCWLADGTPCPSSELHECAGHGDYRGWWTTHFDAELLFFDPTDLAAVAQGALLPHEPAPYASRDIDAHLFLNPSGVEADMLGTGVQRRYRIGAVSYNRAQGHLYVLEWFADGAAPVVHVFGHAARAPGLPSATALR